MSDIVRSPGNTKDGTPKWEKHYDDNGRMVRHIKRYNNGYTKERTE